MTYQHEAVAVMVEVTNTTADTVEAIISEVMDIIITLLFITDIIIIITAVK
jgi:hypothetical protein